MSTASRTSNADENSKRQKTCHDEKSKDSQTHRHPRSFVTWNCNGLTSRCCFNLVDLKRLLDETNNPDMICMQEVRLAAIGPIGRQRGIPKKDDAKKKKKNLKQHKSVKETLNALQSVFGEYKPFWSLADTMYSGTLTLIHQRCLLEASSNDFAAFTPQSAVDLMLRRLGKTRQECGLSKPSPTKKTRQTSLTSFFAPNKQADGDHDAEGRFQFFFFPDMDVVHTYVPNNGTIDESFERRRNWDEDLLQFWKDRKQVLDSCCCSEKATSSSGTTDVVSKDRRLLWCGDLNVARDYRDGTHWERRPGPSSTKIYEWWTDESRCLAQDSLQKNPTKNKKPENVGMPSFTPAERSRFSEMIQVADFCDVWRELHPNGAATLREIDDSKDDNGSTTTTTTITTTSNPWDLPNYTWRGAAAIKSGERPAKYQGRGQRLDYFLLSPHNRFSVKSCEILGQGERKGLFCGSDHCAVSLNI